MTSTWKNSEAQSFGLEFTTFRSPHKMFYTTNGVPQSAHGYDTHGPLSGFFTEMLSPPVKAFVERKHVTTYGQYSPVFQTREDIGRRAISTSSLKYLGDVVRHYNRQHNTVLERYLRLLLYRNSTPPGIMKRRR